MIAGGRLTRQVGTLGLDPGECRGEETSDPLERIQHLAEAIMNVGS
jgi:hypothetical protein